MIQELQTRYGTMFIPDTDTAQYDWLRFSGAAADDEEICRVRDLLSERPRGVVVDAGACFGVWTLAMAGTAELVIAFEPQPAVHEVLRRNVDANQMENVVVIREGVGEREGVDVMACLDLARPANFGGLAAREVNADQPEAPRNSIRVTTIDRQIRPEQMVSFIKIDTEGHEIQVLRGARETIALCRPMIFLETSHPRTDKAALAALLGSMGYVMEPRGPDALCLPL